MHVQVARESACAAPQPVTGAALAQHFSSELYTAS